MLAAAPAVARPPAVGRPGRSPLATLLHEVAKRESITHLRVQTEDELVEWRRAT